MFDPSDILDLPKSFFIGILRVLWWLAWDFCVQTVGWSIGWLVLRILTLSRYPHEPLVGVDQADTGMALFVEMLGLCTLAAVIWYFSGQWPDL